MSGDSEALGFSVDANGVISGMEEIVAAVSGGSLKAVDALKKLAEAYTQTNGAFSKSDTTLLERIFSKAAEGSDQFASSLDRLYGRAETGSTKLGQMSEGVAKFMEALQNTGGIAAAATAMSEITAQTERSAAAAREATSAYEQLARLKTTLIPPIQGNQGIASGETSIFALGGPSAQVQAARDAAEREARLISQRASTQIYQPGPGNAGLASYGGSLLDLGAQYGPGAGNQKAQTQAIKDAMDRLATGINEQAGMFASDSRISNYVDNLKRIDAATAKIAIEAEEAMLDQAQMANLLHDINADYARINAAAAQQAEATKLNDALTASNKGSGIFGGGLINSASKGFFGNDDHNIGTSIGQAARFGLVYSSMYKVLSETEKIFQEAFTSAVEFQKSVVELQLQTGQSANSAGTLANELQSTATQYGESGSAGIEAGQTALGVFGVTNSSSSTQGAVANGVAQVAAKLAYVSGKPINELVDGIGAMTQSFHQGAESAGLVADIIAKYAQQYDLNAGDLLDATPKIAPLGQTLGFSQTQLVALIASTAARTGEAPSAAVSGADTFLGKLLTGPLLSEMQALGVTGKTPAEKFASLSDKFNNGDLSVGVKNQILADAGRSGVNRDIATAILEAGGPAVASANGTSTQGALDKQVAALQNTLGGELRTLSGEFKQLAVDLAQSGLFNDLGLLIKGLEGLLSAVDGVVKLFNELPGPLRETLVALATANLVGKITGIGSVTGLGSKLLGGEAALGLGGKLGGRYADGLVARGIGVAGEDGLITAAEGAGLGAKAGALGEAFSGMAAGLVSTTTVIGGVAIAGGLVAKAAYDYVQAQTQANDALKLTATNVGKLGDPDVYAGAISGLQGASKQFSDNTHLFGLIGGDHFYSLGQNNKAQAKSINDAVATSQADQPQASDTSLGSGVFGDFSTTGIQSGLQSLTQNGYTAEGALKQLNAQLSATGTLSDTAKINYQRVAGDVVAAFSGAVAGSSATFTNGGTGSGGDVQSLSSLNSKLTEGLSQGDLSGYLQGFTKANGITGALTPAQTKAAATGYAKILAAKAGPGDTGTDDSIAAAVEKLLEDLFQKTVDGYQNGIKGQSTQQALTNIKNAVSLQSAEQYLPSDFAGQISGQKTLLGTENSNIGTSSNTDPAGFAELFNQRDLTHATIGQSLVAQSQSVLTAASKSDTTVAQATADGKAALDKLLGLAADNGDTADITSLVEKYGQAAVAVAQKAINDAYNATVAGIKIGAELKGIPLTDPSVQAALTNATNVKNASESALTVAKAALPSTVDLNAARAQSLAPANDPVALANAAVQAAKAQVIDQAAISKTSIAYYQAVTALHQAQYSAMQASLAAEQQVNTTAATKTGGSVASSAAALKNAQLAVTAAGTDAVALQIALNGLYAAQQAAADAVLQAASVSQQLHIDRTDPVAVANQAVKDAQAKLASDKKLGLGKQVTNQDLLDVQNAKATAQQAAFDQAQSDQQVALQTGAESVQSYLAYEEAKRAQLEAERAGMKKGSEGYRQATNDINTLTSNILQAADSTNSQFNLGSIKIPTVYDVRRYLSSTVGGVLGHSAGGATAANQTVINVNGADTGTVLQLLSQYLGGSSVHVNGAAV